MAVGGGSADRKADELASLGDDSAGAWAAGAEGERRVAEALAVLPEAWTVLHDRLLSPGLSPVNLDHVVVGPGGVFLVDAKNWRGAITAWEGNLYQHTGTREARQSASKHAEVAKVHGMAAYMAAESGMPVTPVICLAGRGASRFGDPQLIRGVWVVPVTAVSSWLLAQPSVLDRDGVERRSVTLMTSFPSTTTDPHLLAAMGSAAAATKPRPQRGRRSPAKAAPPRAARRRGAFSRTVRTLVALVLIAGGVALVANVLPAFILGGIADTVSANGARNPSATASAPSSPTGSAKASATATAVPAQKRAAASPAPAAPRCGGLTTAQVSKVLSRTMQPVAARQGCTWGTRLDDPATVLVSLATKAEHRADEYQYVTSARERRVVYGGAYDSNHRLATAAWVAAGQPLSPSRNPVVARADTYVVVSTKALEISDDRARRMALPLVTAMNTAG